MLTTTSATYYNQKDLATKARTLAKRDMATRKRHRKRFGLDSYDVKVCNSGVTILVAHYHDATGIHHVSIGL